MTIDSTRKEFMKLTKDKLVELIIAKDIVEPQVVELSDEDIGNLFAERCLRPRHCEWVKRMGTSPAHPSVARVIELSVCAQYQQDDTKGGSVSGGSTIKARDFSGV